MNELVKINKRALAKLEKNGISDIIKPLKKEIELVNTFIDVDGLSKKILSEQKVSDELVVKRDIKNMFDKKAVAIYDKNNNKIGYVSEIENSIIANLIDAGKLIKSKINFINNTSKDLKLNVKIYMEDF